MNTLYQFFNAPLWQQSFLGNSFKSYIVAMTAFASLLVLFALFQRLILKRLQKAAETTKSDVDDELIKIVRTIKPPFYSFLAFYLALNFLDFGGFVEKVVSTVLIAWFVYQVIQAMQILISYIAIKKIPEENQQSRTAVNVITMVAKILLWTIALLMILSNIGVNITSLIAGLGIGGIAVAMAIKGILSDLFGAFAIYFDKPFLEGDFIIVNDKTMGVVQEIGIKTTRIRAPQGEEIVLPNNDLTSAKIQNFRKLEERRVSFSLGVAYETPTAKLKRIPRMIEEIVGFAKKARFDRAYFTKFADSALNFDIVYYVESSEYADYLKTNQEILFKIKEKFETDGISMAYPTQTLYIEKQG